MRLLIGCVLAVAAIGSVAGEVNRTIVGRAMNRKIEEGEVVIPGRDYILVEKTLGKFGNRVEVLNKLPINLQHLVRGK